MIDKDRIIGAAIEGQSMKAIARRCECSVEEVGQVLDAFAVETLSPRARARTLTIEVERLDRLERVFLEYAIERNDAAAGTLVTKLSQRRAALLGLDQPARMDMSVVVEPYEDKSTTLKLLESIRLLKASDPAAKSNGQNHVEVKTGDISKQSDEPS
jgi:hypothetical protein